MKIPMNLSRGVFVGGFLLTIVGSIGLGVLFGGRYFTHLTTLTGSKATSIALTTLSAAAIPGGLALSFGIIYLGIRNRPRFIIIEQQT